CCRRGKVAGIIPTRRGDSNAAELERTDEERRMDRRHKALWTAAAVISAAIVLGGTMVRAAEDPGVNGVKRITSIEGITEYALDNGLRILLFPDPSKPTVTVTMTVLVGSRHEGYGEAGMAHLLEHMLFKGTPDHPNIPSV